MAVISVPSKERRLNYRSRSSSAHGTNVMQSGKHCQLQICKVHEYKLVS